MSTLTKGDYGWVFYLNIKKPWKDNNITLSWYVLTLTGKCYCYNDGQMFFFECLHLFVMANGHNLFLTYSVTYRFVDLAHLMQDS